MACFTELTRLLDRLSAEYGIPGCDCAVTLDGKLIYRHGAGFNDVACQKPVSGRETYWMYSATKLITCTAALRLMEEGKLELDAPVGRYLPEFMRLTVRKENGKIYQSQEQLTVKHLMTMTGGLDYDLLRPALVQALQNGASQTCEIVAALAKDPLCFEPGSHFLYSLCHDVLGAVVERASGMGFSEYVRQRITEPLGMENTTFHPTEKQQKQMAAQYAWSETERKPLPSGEKNHFRFTEAYESGGAGLMSTVDDYIRFATALALGGISQEGVRILSESSVNLMKTDFLGPIQRQDFLRRSPAARGYSYGLGVQVLVEDVGTGVPLGEFGWDGAAGAYVLVDTSNRLAMVYAQHLCGFGRTYQEIHPALRDTLYRCIGKAGQCTQK